MTHVFLYNIIVSKGQQKQMPMNISEQIFRFDIDQNLRNMHLRRDKIAYEANIKTCRVTM
jgi:uncharacterized membrane protein